MGCMLFILCGEHPFFVSLLRDCFSRETDSIMSAGLRPGAPGLVLFILHLSTGDEGGTLYAATAMFVFTHSWATAFGNVRG